MSIVYETAVCWSYGRFFSLNDRHASRAGWVLRGHAHTAAGHGEPVTLTTASSIDAMFKRKRGRPPKNRIIEVTAFFRAFSFYFADLH